MKYLHTMIRVYDVDKTVSFFKLLGLQVIRRKDHEEGRFSLIFLATKKGEPEVELTYNWDQDTAYLVGDNFGHLAFQVDDIYETCHKLQEGGVVIARPPRDGHMAFVRSPDQISIELLQKGEALPKEEPWSSMPNQGKW